MSFSIKKQDEVVVVDVEGQLIVGKSPGAEAEGA